MLKAEGNSNIVVFFFQSICAKSEKIRMHGKDILIFLWLKYHLLFTL